MGYRITQSEQSYRNGLKRYQGWTPFMDQTGMPQCRESPFVVADAIRAQDDAQTKLIDDNFIHIILQGE